MERQVQAGNGTIRIAGVDLALDDRGVVREQNLARFQGKITNGDYSYDSDPLLSVWVMSSFVGGIGAEYLKEGVDDENYWTGSLETRFPSMLSLLPQTLSFDGPTASEANAYPLADFPASSPNLYATFGLFLAKWDNVNEEFVEVGGLDTEPPNKAVEFDNLLWIPQGGAGYATVSTTGTITKFTDIDVVAFCLWDNKLAALTTDGVLRLRPAAGGAWEAESADLKLPSGHLPRNLLVFINQQSEPSIHIITHRDVWAYDRENSRIIRTHLQYPRHPDQARASTVWRGESMYVSVGVGVHAYNGGIVSSMGLDGRYGLPAHLRGRISDLEPEYNSLIAVVEGNLESNDPDQNVQISSPTYIDSLRPFKDYSAYSAVYRYSGYGWHPVWVSPSPDGRPTWAFVSEADGEYRLWWGYAGKMYRQDLRVTFHNPKAGMEVGVDRFGKRGSIVTGWYDADMPGFDKLLSHMEITTTDVYGDGTPTGLVKVEYQKDDDTSWSILGQSDRVGRRILPFDVRPGEQCDNFSYGMKVRRVRFRITLESNDPNQSPIVESVLLKFVKIPLTSMSWTVNINLMQKNGFMGWGPEETAEFLYNLESGDSFHEMIHRDKSFRIRVAQATREGRSGHDNRSIMVLSVVEVQAGREQLKAVPVGTP